MSRLTQTEKIRRIKSSYPRLYRDLKRHVPGIIKKPHYIPLARERLAFNALIVVYQNTTGYLDYADALECLKL